MLVILTNIYDVHIYFWFQVPTKTFHFFLTKKQYSVCIDQGQFNDIQKTLYLARIWRCGSIHGQWYLFELICGCVSRLYNILRI